MRGGTVLVVAIAALVLGAAGGALAGAAFALRVTQRELGLSSVQTSRAGEAIGAAAGQRGTEAALPILAAMLLVAVQRKSRRDR